jgi:hypothetical protein
MSKVLHLPENLALSAFEDEYAINFREALETNKSPAGKFTA